MTLDKATQAAICLSEDLQMLADGTWEPDNDSIEASQDSLSIIIEFLSELQDKS